MTERLEQAIKQVVEKSTNLSFDLLLEFDHFINILPKAKSITIGCNPNTLDLIFEKEQRRKQRKTRDAMNKLKKKKLIKIEKLGDKFSVALTQKGRFEVLRIKIISNQTDLQQGENCLVSFDIPEHLRHVRDNFRAFLKQAGFTQIHQSLWMSNKNIMREMCELVKITKREKWIQIYHAYRFS